MSLDLLIRRLGLWRRGIAGGFLLCRRPLFVSFPVGILVGDDPLNGDVGSSRSRSHEVTKMEAVACTDRDGDEETRDS